jgi:hypothetical protein
MTWSIHRRLLAGLVSGVLLSGMISAAVIYVRAREADELPDRQPKQDRPSRCVNRKTQRGAAGAAVRPGRGKDSRQRMDAGLPVFGLAVTGKPCRWKRGLCHGDLAESALADIHRGRKRRDS